MEAVQDIDKKLFFKYVNEKYPKYKEYYKHLDHIEKNGFSQYSVASTFQKGKENEFIMVTSLLDYVEWLEKKCKRNHKRNIKQ